MKYWSHREGTSGQEVERIQKILNIKQDGKYGPITKAAVEQFQSSNNLSVDGIVGPQTRKEMAIDIYAGIDVSRWQGDIDWDTLKSSGLVDFCWVKVTEGNTHVHKGSPHNISECRRLNVPVGGYHFARPDLHTDPYKEVENFVKNCPMEVGDLKPVFDFEVAGGTHDKESLRVWAVDFLEEFEKESGIRPVVYTGGNMVKYKLKSTKILEDYILWHALYSKRAIEMGIPKDRLGGWKEWRIWQWTGSGTLPGVTTKIDRNWLVGGPTAFKEVLIQ